MTTMEKTAARSTTSVKSGSFTEIDHTDMPKARGRKTAPKAAPKVEPEADLSSYASREPSDVNKAEAIWFIQNGGIEVRNERELELVQKAVQLTAGTAHRLFQGSKAAAKVHGK